MAKTDEYIIAKTKFFASFLNRSGNNKTKLKRKLVKVVELIIDANIRN